MITGFSVRNLKHKLLMPSEDSFKFKQTARGITIACADGITRDFEDGTPVGKDLRSLYKLLLRYYPNPSDAKQAADMFCDSFEDFIEELNNCTPQFSEKNSGEEIIKIGFKFSNKNIFDYNKRKFPEPNYLENDLAGCVASAALVKGRDAFYGFIADCGVAVFDSKEDLKLKTENQGPHRGPGNLIDKDVEEKYGKSFEEQEGRKIIRSQYRNNPSNYLAYGALTGEEVALEYVRTGYYEIKDNDVVMLFTDGLEKMLDKGEFIDKLREGKEKGNFSELKKFCKKNVGSEGSAVIYVADWVAD